MKTVTRKTQKHTPSAVDVSDSKYRSPEFWLRHGQTDLTAKLVELVPYENPPEQSGAMIYLSDLGEDAWLHARIGPQIIGHCLGYLTGSAVRIFLREALSLAIAGCSLEGAEKQALRFVQVRSSELDEEDEQPAALVAELGDLYAGMQVFRASGGALRLDGFGEAAELTIYFGSHCFGVLRGRDLRSFLARALLRCMEGEQVERPEEFTDFDLRLLWSAGIDGSSGGRDGR